MARAAGAPHWYLFLLIALSIGVITDINRPMSGRSRESQEPMLMLLRSLKSQPPEVFDQFDVPLKDSGRQGSRQ